MKCLVLITDAFGANGGIAKFNRDVLKALSLHPNFDEIVALPRAIPFAFDSVPQKIRYAQNGIGGKVRYVLALFKLMAREKNFDLILCGHIHLVPLACLAGRFFRAPVLLFIHGIEAWRPTGIINKRLVKSVSAFVSVSQTTKRRFLKWANLSERDGFILHNCVDLNKFRAGEKPPFLLSRYGLDGKTVILTLGRLASEDRRKGFDEVLDVLPELTEEIPGLVYVIAGEGRDKGRLMEKVKRLNLENKVVFTGFVPENEKEAHYQVADVYAMPSQGEGFGIVLLEAMACGIPVVGSKLDGSREALKGGELGILVNPRNHSDVKSGILGALCRKKGEKRAEVGDFSFENFKIRFHRIIDHAMARGDA